MICYIGGMKLSFWSLWALAGILGLAGCATQTVESRKHERPAAYAALPAALQSLVDKGEIKVGMNEDAVYLAWGKPSQILKSETAAGAVTTWLYQDTTLQGQYYWTYREVSYGDGRSSVQRYLDHDYQTRDYVRAEITFANGAVTQWRTLPKPVD